jgi:alkylhydroperoxidase family enzyme
MPRVRPVESIPAPPPDADRATMIQSTIGRIMAHRPEIAAGIGAASMAINTSGTLPARLVELIRLRIAFHNQCRSCMAVRYPESLDDGLTEDLVCSLERPYESPDLTDGERAALRFADLFATDHLSIDDAVYDELRQYYSEDQLVEIGLICAISVGIGRLAATWHVVEHVPELLQRPGPVAPWNIDAALASAAVPST